MTYTIRPAEISNGQVKVVVDFVDGSVKYDKSFFPQSVDDLKAKIQEELNLFTKNETLLVEIQKGIPDLVIPVDQNAVDRKIWFDKYFKYKQLLQAVAEKLLASDDVSIFNLLADLKATYKAEYGVF